MLQYHCAVQKKVNSSQIVSLPQSDRQIKTFTGVHTYIHKAHIYACTHMHACTCMHTCLYTHMHTHTYACMHTYVCPYTCAHTPFAGRYREAVTSRTVISRSPPYKHTPFGGPMGSHPKRLCWVQRSGGKDQQDGTEHLLGRAGRMEVRTLRGCDCAPGEPESRQPPCWKESLLRKMRSWGHLASLLQLLPQRGHPLDPKRSPFSSRGPWFPSGSLIPSPVLAPQGTGICWEQLEFEFVSSYSH